MVCKPLAYLERSTCVQSFCHPGHSRGQNGERAFTLVSPRGERLPVRQEFEKTEGLRGVTGEVRPEGA